MQRLTFSFFIQRLIFPTAGAGEFRDDIGQDLLPCSKCIVSSLVSRLVQEILLLLDLVNNGLMPLLFANNAVIFSFLNKFCVLLEELIGFVKAPAILDHN